MPPARVAEAAKDLQALLGKHGFLPGSAGHASAGNLHFLLTPNFGEAARSRALRRVHARARRADRRQVRRLAEGRARHGHEHGPVRRARVGGEGDRADVAGQAARRPRRDPRPRRRAQPRPGRAPAATSSRRPRSRRSRPSASSAASASRCAPRATSPPRRASGSCCAARWPASRPARRCSRRCSSSTSTTRSRPAPPTARACTRARWRSTPASWSRSCATASTSPRAERAALAVARRYAARRAPRRARVGVGGPRRRRRRRGAVGAAGQRATAPRPPSCRPPRARAPPPCTCPSCINRIFGNARGAAPARPTLPEALVAVSAARRAAAVDPRRRCRPLLRDALELEGLRARPRAHGRPDRGGAAPLERRAAALPVVIDASSCTHGLLDRASASTASRCSTRSRGCTTICSSGSRSPAGWAASPFTRRAPRAPRPVGQAACDRRADRRRSRRPGRHGLLRDGRRPRLASPRAARDALGDVDARARRPHASTPACRATGPASWRCQQVTGRPIRVVRARAGGAHAR